MPEVKKKKHSRGSNREIRTTYTQVITLKQCLNEGTHCGLIMGLWGRMVDVCWNCSSSSEIKSVEMRVYFTTDGEYPASHYFKNSSELNTFI